MTGHLLGGAGALESIATVLALHHRVVPPTINLDNLDPQVELDIATEARDLPERRHRGAEQLLRLRRRQRRRRLRERLKPMTATDARTAKPRQLPREPAGPAQPAQPEPARRAASTRAPSS